MFTKKELRNWMILVVRAMTMKYPEDELKEGLIEGITEQIDIYIDSIEKEKAEAEWKAKATATEQTAMTVLTDLSGGLFTLHSDWYTIMEDWYRCSWYKYNKEKDFIIDFACKWRPQGTIEWIRKFYTK